MLAAAAAVALTGTLAAGLAFWRSGRETPPVSNVRSFAVLPFDAAAASDAREALQGLAASLADTLARESDLTVIAGALRLFAASRDRRDHRPIARGRRGARDPRRAVRRSPADRRRGRHGNRSTHLVGVVRSSTRRAIRSRACTRRRPRAALHLPSSSRGATTASPARGVDPRAYDLYLRSRYHTGRWNEAEVASGIAMLEQATSIDPHLGRRRRCSRCSTA